MKTTGKVSGIISNIVIVRADGAVAQNEICYVYCGDTRMMAEVIKVIGDDAYVQVYDSTRGLKIGDRVEFEGHMLQATLAPGLLSRNYDGLQNDLEKMPSLFIERGTRTEPLDFDVKWEFKPLANVNDKHSVNIFYNIYQIIKFPLMIVILFLNIKNVAYIFLHKLKTYS